MHRTTSRPRKAEAIYSATLDLLTNRGYDALTIEAIAEHAGVNKTTIYRTWASKDDLFAEALVHAPQLRFDIPDTGTLRGDLIAVGREINQLLTQHSTRRIITAALSALPSLPDRSATAKTTRAFFADRLRREQVIFDRARERWELKHDTDPTMVIDLIAGNLWLQTFARPGVVDDAYVVRLIDTVLAGVTRGRDSEN